MIDFEVTEEQRLLYDSIVASGADAITMVLALEALGYGCSDNGLIFSLDAQMWE